MAKAELLQIQRANIGFDRPHRIGPINVVFYPCRQQARLLAVLARFECAIRHPRIVHQSAKPSFLPSLIGCSTLWREAKSAYVFDGPLFASCESYYAHPHNHPL